MNFTKKIDRAFQWAGEKMGAEAKTSMSDDFKMLETEMALRYDGMERLQKSMTAYVKWIGRRNETFEDREKGLAASYLGRTMVGHGEDFEPDSEFGACLTSLGRGNERIAAAQERYVADATATWLESLERSLAMMKEYQAARKKLENRRLAYDASIGKLQKAKRDDFRAEEELRANRAKYEESSEDVLRRMQDVKDAEVDSIRDLTGFLDCELEYYERCADELRRIKRSWPGAATAAAAAGASGSFTNGSGSINGGGSVYGGRSRSNTARSYTEQQRTASYSSFDRMGSSGRGGASAGDAYAPDDEPEPMPVRMPIRSNTRVTTPAPDRPPRPAVSRSSSSYQQSANAAAAGYASSGYAADRSRPSQSGTATPTGGAFNMNAAAASVSSLRSGLRPVGRIQTGGANGNGNVFSDEADDTASGGSGTGSPDWGGERSASPATSFDSLSRSTSNIGARKPPPPPPNRSKKPPPPVPAPRR